MPLVAFVLVLAALPLPLPLPLPLDGLLLGPALVLAYGDASPAARRGRPLLLPVLLVAAAAARFEAAVVRPVLGVLVPAIDLFKQHRLVDADENFNPRPRKDRKKCGGDSRAQQTAPPDP